MVANPSFEIVDISGEYMAIPVGEKALAVKGVVVLNEAAAFLLRHMKDPQTVEELSGLLTTEYQVDEETAKRDIDEFVNKVRKIGLIVDN